MTCKLQLPKLAKEHTNICSPSKLDFFSCPNTFLPVTTQAYSPTSSVITLCPSVIFVHQKSFLYLVFWFKKIGAALIRGGALNTENTVTLIEKVWNVKTAHGNIHGWFHLLYNPDWLCISLFLSRIVSGRTLYDDIQCWFTSQFSNKHLFWP